MRDATRMFDRAVVAVLSALMLTLGTPATAAASVSRAGPPVSAATRLRADAVLAGKDAHGEPFAIVDKTAATVVVFGRDGTIVGGAPVLIGLARGDTSVPGIGNRPLAEIRPAERTTPAGRFPATMGTNAAGHTILWVDYDAAISLHAVVTSKPAERRLERLATPTPDDNRISYGCINVPADFFRTIVVPTFSGTAGIVYILPEMPVAASQ